MIDVREQKFNIGALADGEGGIVLYLAEQTQIQMTAEQYDRVRRFFQAQSAPRKADEPCERMC